MLYCIIFVLIIHITLLVLFRTNIVRFYKNIWKAMLVATTSRSNMGTHCHYQWMA
ncbi:MAG: cation:dicarboxylase symporter family transporter [Francisella endosymbiont of Hyalomma asiaticum]